MAVSLPDSGDVQEARERAATSAAERAEVARTPLYAMLGAGEYAVSAVSKAVSGARARTTDAHLPHRMSGEELRKLLDELRAQFEKVYGELAGRGEQTWEQWRAQPQFQQAVTNLKSYTEKLDAQVDTLVDEAREAGEKALGTVSRQTRSAGERVARSTQRFSARAAGTVESAGQDVAEVGSEAAEVIAGVGDEAAHETRSTSRKTANRIAPAQAPHTAAAKAAARKPATPGNGSTAEPGPKG